MNKNLATPKTIDSGTGAVTAAGTPAYAMGAKLALAQLVSTGTFNNTYYSSGMDQLNQVKMLAAQCDPEFVAKAAVFARQAGYMKDAPAYLCAYLSSMGRSDLVEKIFPKVIDNTKMLRNYVQMMRSGTTGRKSLGTRPRKLVQNWLGAKTDSELFRGSIGNSPSLADVIKLSHPKPKTPEREAMYRYFLGKECETSALPLEVQAFEVFKKDFSSSEETPNVPFEMLTSLPLTKEHWMQVARRASWTQTRMNLNTFQRHGVYENKELVNLMATKLSNPELIKKAKAFPYQLLAAFLNVEPGMPRELIQALETAMEHAIDNVPEFLGNTRIFPDVSGSMSSPMMGNRGTVSSKMTYIDVAALMAVSVLRKNPGTSEVIPFDTRIHNFSLKSEETVLQAAARLRQFGGGGTYCGLPLKMLNERKDEANVCIFVSDNESNVGRGYGTTDVLNEWNRFSKRNEFARLICIDLQPGLTTQAPDREDILNVGGASDSIWNVIRDFSNTQGRNHWAETIEKIDLN